MSERQTKAENQERNTHSALTHSFTLSLSPGTLTLNEGGRKGRPSSGALRVTVDPYQI